MGTTPRSKGNNPTTESINTAADQRGVTGTPTLFLDDKAVDMTGLTPTGLETMIADALQVDTGLQTLPTDEINYMRNAVKATVDAYSGEVSLYAWDEEDPLLRAWMGAFPGTVKPKSDMSEQLLEHVTGHDGSRGRTGLSGHAGDRRAIGRAAARVVHRHG